MSTPKINPDFYVGNTGVQLKDIKSNSDQLNNKLKNVALSSSTDSTSFTVYGGPYATILVISMYYVGIIALNNGSQNVHNIYGGIPSLTFNWLNSTTIEISGFESWNHHILIGSNTISTIVAN